MRVQVKIPFTDRTSAGQHEAAVGFTLIEVLIASALLSIFMLTITDIFTAALDVQKESRATSAVAEDSRFVMERFTYDVNRATAISTPASAGSSGSSLVMTVDGTTVTYALSSGVLQRTDGSGANALTSSETTASSLTFDRLGPNPATIRMTVTLTSVTRAEAGQQAGTFSTTAGRRL